MSAINIVEVGARDGLQNESVTLLPVERIELIQRLSKTGLTTIEAGSFVSPKWVPQMAGSDEVLSTLVSDPTLKNINLPVLTPNLKGFQSAADSGAKEVAIFGAASETFSQKNINCSIAESLQRFEAVCEQAHDKNIRVRGYLSCLVACPYEGVIDPAQVIDVVRKLFELGCYEVSLGDTIGRGTPKSIRNVLTVLLKEFKADTLALHCHDTYGMAITNIHEALNMGITTFDASVGGAGGCPYATGASGNVATEDLTYFLESEGLATHVNLDDLVETSAWLFAKLGRKPASKVHQALIGNQR
jgi:hydroxymethylglutaryl-CoA lyase